MASPRSRTSYDQLGSTHPNRLDDASYRARTTLQRIAAWIKANPLRFAATLGGTAALIALTAGLAAAPIATVGMAYFVGSVFGPFAAGFATFLASEKNPNYVFGGKSRTAHSVGWGLVSTIGFMILTAASPVIAIIVGMASLIGGSAAAASSITRIGQGVVGKYSVEADSQPGGIYPAIRTALESDLTGGSDLSNQFPAPAAGYGQPYVGQRHTINSGSASTAQDQAPCHSIR